MRIIEENPGASASEMKRALSKSYPFGERKYWPYRVWLHECHRTMARLFLGECVEPGAMKGRGAKKENPNQMEIQ